MRITDFRLRITDGKTIAALVAIVLLGFISIILLSSSLDSYQEVVIREGWGVKEIADMLKDKTVINNKTIFIIYTLAMGYEKKLQAGRYVFPSGATIPSIVYSISEGFAESDDILVTIPEGFNVFDIDKRLFRLGLIQEGEFARKYYNDEGQFFPDTYLFKKEGETVDTIAEKMKNHLNLKFEEISLVLNTLVFHDTIVKASIIEKETRKEEDMRLVAGVIENRLAKGMLLQVDATVSYGACRRQLEFGILNLESGYRYCDVSQVPVGAEIKVDGPYNTYIRTGLLPDPIANPGITAIRAVLNPTPSDYLYYLSTRDGSQIIYSKTASEHAANRRKYLGI